MQSPTRRAFAFAAAAAWLAAPAFAADSYPSRPIRILVGFAAGGSTDAVTRIYAEKLSRVLNTPVIVDNKPGAQQMLAIRSILTAAPDGYTLYMGTGSTFSQMPGARKASPYDPLKDFTLVGLAATTPGVLVVSPSLPVHDLKELIALSRAAGSKLNYGSSGIGSASHLQTEYLLQVTGARLVHIPYKSDADIMRELQAGSLHLGMSTIQAAAGAIAAGKVRAIAVTGARRLAALPDVPSLRETGLPGVGGIDPYSYYGLVGPAGMPAAVVDRLNAAINRVSVMPDVVSHMENLHFEPEAGTPEQFRQLIAADLRKWTAFGKVINLPD